MFIVIKEHKIELRYLVKEILIAAVGLFFLSIGIPIAKGIIRTNWPTTTGTILSAKLEEGIYYGSMHVRLSYEYFVENNKYIGRYIHEGKDLPFKVKKAEKIISTKYRISNQVKIYYNPRDPEIAFLEPGPKVYEIIIFCLGLFFIAGSGYIIHAFIKDTIDEVDYTYKEPIKKGIERGEQEDGHWAPKTTRELIVAALTLEDVNPHQAVNLYHQAKKNNKEFSMLILVASFTALVLASILAFYTVQTLERYGKILSVPIIAFIGFGLPANLRALRDYRNGVVTILAPKPFSVLNAVISGPYFMFEMALVSLTAMLFTFFAVGPLLAMGLLGTELQWRVIDNPYIIVALQVFCGATACFSVLAVLADIWYSDLWPPISGVRILFAGLRANLSGVLGYLSALVAGYVFVSLISGESAILPSSFQEAVIGGGISGIFLALALSRGDLSTKMKVFIQLGLSRCNISQHNWCSARIPLRKMFVQDTCKGLFRNDSKALCGYLSNHLISLTEGIREGYRPNDLEGYIVEAEKVIGPDVPDREIWIKNIMANRLLAESEEVRNALDRAKKIRGLAEKVFPDLGCLVQLYWGAGVICFLWWMLKVLRA